MRAISRSTRSVFILFFVPKKIYCVQRNIIAIDTVFRICTPHTHKVIIVSTSIFFFTLNFDSKYRSVT